MPDNGPLVSFIVVTYKQERFVREAVRSALAQDYHPLEIIISDDCSPDGTFGAIQEEVAAYTGPHRVVVHQNPMNLGLVGNLNEAWKLASGDFVVIQAGDDVSVPERVSEVVRCWLESGRTVDLVCSHFAEIDESGKATGVIKRNVVFLPDVNQDAAMWTCGATGACAAYSRRIFEKYGPVDTRVLSEDWVYAFRAWVESGIKVVEKPLVLHRIHDDCLSVVYGRGVAGKEKRGARQKRRHRMADSYVGISENWLRAWELGPRGGDDRRRRELQKRVELGRMEADAFRASWLGGLRLTCAAFVRGGGFKRFSRMIAHHVVRYGY